MKTTASIFTKITLGVLLAGSIAACNQNKPADKTAAATATPADKPEIVYVNQDTLSLKYQYSKDMRKRLEEKGKSAQNDVGGRKQAFQREVVEYQKGANVKDKNCKLMSKMQLPSSRTISQAKVKNYMRKFTTLASNMQRTMVIKWFSPLPLVTLIYYMLIKALT
jgi:outer membrane protein